MEVRHADVIVIGSGIAGLMVAELLSLNKNVMIITKSKFEHSNSIIAQGGIAAAVSQDDHWQDHLLDTIVAGSYHNHYRLTKLLVQKGPLMIEKLTELGVRFDREEDGNFSLGQEGAHGKRRILHSGGDATGLEIVTRLIERIKNKVTIFENEMAYELLMDNGECIGVSTLNKSGRISLNIAPYTILATGGAGQLYEVTSNCEQVTGDGMALAYRVGARLVDLEFIQFHPTMLVKNNSGIGLVSEAVRGEGARLVTANGNYLMEGKHPLKDLAPRDVVAREIYHSINQGEQIFLDISQIKNFNQRFPTIASLCEKGGIEWQKGLIPVAPGAHFCMGGIETNQFGQTSIEGLYAVGEVARTGVHGANRLASNSLLEGLVFAHEVAQFIGQSHRFFDLKDINIKYEEKNLSKQLPAKKEIQKIMTKLVGIVRTKAGLEEAIDWFDQYKSLLENHSTYMLSKEEKTICNMLTVGRLIATSALIRTESRGGHFREDFPIEQDGWRTKKICCSIHQQQPYVVEEEGKVALGR